MAIIKPFKGVRPPQDLVEQVASRPYDVLNSEEARIEAEGNEKSLYHIIKPEIDFPVGTDEHDERVYQKAAENFRMFQEKGWLVQDDKENYYVYAQTMNGKTQYGLVVGAYVPDYMNGVIKKHELTRRDKEEDRMKHVRVNNANIEPVFFAYPDNAALDAVISRYTVGKPVYDFIAPGDGFGHTFWIIDKQEDIDAITQEFAKMPALYIADGHHRSAAAALVGAEKAKQNPNHRGDEEYNYFMAVCFPANQLTIIDLSVKRGKVKVLLKQEEQTVFVEAGETVILQGGSLLVSETENPELFDRYTSNIRFKDECLEDVLRAINKESAGWQIEAASPTLGKRRLTVEFSNNSPESVAELICWTFDLKCTRQGNRLILSEQ